MPKDRGEEVVGRKRQAPPTPGANTFSQKERESPGNEEGFVVPAALPFKISQSWERYPKGQARGRHWKHLKQIIQGENYHLCPVDEANYVTIEAPPSMYPAKKYCDITGFEAKYSDPRTKLRFANTDAFQRARILPEQYVQGYLSLRNAVVVLK